ncbi:hypothetical protein SEA_CECE_253 [Microbacterium phage Cece]|nr:hypothetical protein SEA_CECE_253 [Microbacterium phage Cece]
MRATTSSGSVYEFTKDGGKVRRLTKRHDIDPHAEDERPKLEGDGRWLPLFETVEPVVGQPMVLPLVDEGGVEVRMSSVVVGVEE